MNREEEEEKDDDKLKEFDAELFYCIINLDLSNNLIEKILNFSKIIKDFEAGKQNKLQKLQTLNLNNNNFSFLNNTAFPLVKTALNFIISNNSLKEFGDNFFKLSNKSNLELINLNDNQIEVLRSIFNKQCFTNLKYFLIKANKIKIKRVFFQQKSKVN